MRKLYDPKFKRAIIIIALLALYMAAAELITGSICIVRSTIGLPCPGCGLTRAYQLLFTANLTEAFFFHPLFWFIPIFALVYLFKWIKYKNENPKWFIIFSASSIAVFFAVYFVRMILYFPHTEPLTFNTKTLIARIIHYIMS